jgi:hypothetical protein
MLFHPESGVFLVCNLFQRIGKMKTIIRLGTILLLFTSGCQNNETKQALEQLDALKQQNSKLTEDLAELQKQSEQLKNQVTVLAALPEKIPPEKIYNLQQVKIVDYSNLYDKNKDGKIDTLLIYIEPIDDHGDSIKAAGSLEIQLWDLNKTADKSLLGEWKITAETIKKLWVISFISAHYRLSLDVTGKIEKYDGPLTINVTFTDYLTGKVFKEQKTITPVS